jgi:hypothetical protein
VSEARAFALRCPGCGAGLKFDQSIDTFACVYCGASIKVDRGDGIVSLRLLTDAMLGVQRGTDRTAAELAIRRLSDELRALENQKEELRSSSQALASAWDQRMKAVSKQDYVLPLFAVYVVTSFVIALVVRGIDGWLAPKGLSLPSPYREIEWAIIVTVIAVTCFFAWRTMRRRRGGIVNREKANRDQGLAVRDAAKVDLQTRIDAVEKKLTAQRLIVDS